MDDLASAPVAPKGWSFLDTNYGSGINEAEYRILESLLKCIASSKACLEIRSFTIPDAPLADAISLGVLIRLHPATCMERSKWLIRHEAVHVLRTLQLFKSHEWDFLSSEAHRSGWFAKFSITQRYKTLNNDIKIEEAVAEAFAFWCERRPITASEKRGICEQAKVFWQNCVNFFTGRGFRSVDDIFYAIAGGVIARRQSNQRRGPTCAKLTSYILDNGPYLFEPQQA